MLMNRLSTDLGSLVRLVNLVKRLDHCSAATGLCGGASVRQQSIDAELDLITLVAAIDEIAEGVAQMKDLDSTITFDGSSQLQEHRERLSTSLKSVEKINMISRSTDIGLFTTGKSHLSVKRIGLIIADERTLLTDVKQQQAALSGSLVSWAERHAQFRHLLLPVLDIVSRMTLDEAELSGTDLSHSAWSESDDLIQSMLVLTQGIKTEAIDHKDDEPIHVPTEFKSLNTLSTSLRIPGVLDRFSTFINNLSSTDSEFSSHIIGRVLPFVQDLAESYSHAISARSYTLKSTYKLGYVVSRLVLDLAQKGFCKPQEQSDSKDEDAGETVDGTGMGSGTGDKNVSSEIEEESQVEGLQGEKEEEGQEKDEENEDDAVSMDNDFEGELGDAKQGEDEEDGSEGDEEEKDDHVGDVDPLDPGAVDEKFWGDEEKEEQKNDGKEDLMNQKDEGGESEMAAKESEGEKKDDKEKKKDDQKEGEQNDTQQGETEEGQQDGDDFDEGEDETNQDEEGDAQGEERDEGGVQDQDDVVMPEGDRLDLPEDMDLGDDGEDEGGEGEEIDDLSMKGDDQGEEVEPSDAGQVSDDDGAVEDDAPAPTGATEEEANEPDDTLNPNVDTSAANDQQAQQSAEAGAGLDGGDDQQGQDKDDVEMVDQEAPTEGEG
jgi:midasin